MKLGFFFENSLVDERKHVAVKAVFSSVCTSDKYDEAHQDVSWVVANSSGKHEAEVHQKAEEHCRTSEAAENEPKADQEFTPRNQDVEQFDVWKGESVQEVNIPAVDDSVRAFDRVGGGAFQESCGVKASSNFAPASSQPHVAKIDT